MFMLDSGLLGALLNLPSRVIVEGDRLFSEYYGAFVENYVATELITGIITPLCYWTSKSDAEVDFLISTSDNLIPLEVKSGYSRQMKSLRVYAEKYQPVRLLRTSPRNFHHADSKCS